MAASNAGQPAEDGVDTPAAVGRAAAFETDLSDLEQLARAAGGHLSELARDLGVDAHGHGDEGNGGAGGERLLEGGVALRAFLDVLGGGQADRARNGREAGQAGAGRVRSRGGLDGGGV